MRSLASIVLFSIVLGMTWLGWLSYRALGGVTYLGRAGVFLQRDAYDCGDAALKMIFDFHRIPEAYEDLHSQLGGSPRGTSMLRLKQVSEEKGLYCEGWRLAFEDLRRIPLPAILFIKGNHYAVLDSFTASGELIVRDPARGRLRVSPYKLKSVWQGEALLFGPGFRR